MFVVSKDRPCESNQQMLKIANLTYFDFNCNLKLEN